MHKICVKKYLEFERILILQEFESKENPNPLFDPGLIHKNEATNECQTIKTVRVNFIIYN